MPHNMACQVVPFSWHEVCQDGKVMHIVCASHVMPSVTHKLRTVHETHLTISSRQVVTPWKTFQNFRRQMARTTSSDRIATHPTHTVTSSSLNGTPNCVPRRKLFVVRVRGSLEYIVHVSYQRRGQLSQKFSSTVCCSYNSSRNS